MQPIKLSLFQAFRRSLILVIQAAPIELLHLILLTLISGAGSPSKELCAVVKAETRICQNR